MTGPAPHERVLCAIDTTDLAEATALASAVAGAVGGIKLGKEFFTAFGPEGVRAVAASGQRIFLDLKYNDIPNTVGGAVRAARALGCFMLTIHASGGPAMVAAAAEAKGGSDGPVVLAVTVLTSLGEDDLAAVGQKGPVAEQVLRLGRMATGAGADGLVASPLEITALRDALGPKPTLVIPGIRPDWASSDDQKRITTPEQALRAGADYLVIGRPITRADNPAQAARRIAAELADA
jgi:orotidine-5'-phosphate decarboxylase